MPAGLQNIESSFKQLQKDYISYAQRRQSLVLEVAAQEGCLARIKQAIRQERQAIERERRDLQDEREAFEAFRSEVLQDLNTQCGELQHERQELGHKQAALNIHELQQHCCEEADCQPDTDSVELSVQRRAFQSVQAELIADLQQRVVHLADVTTDYDDQRERQIYSLQQHIHEDAEIVCQQHRQANRDKATAAVSQDGRCHRLMQ